MEAPLPNGGLCLLAQKDTVNIDCGGRGGQLKYVATHKTGTNLRPALMELTGIPAAGPEGVSFTANWNRVPNAFPKSAQGAGPIFSKYWQFPALRPTDVTRQPAKSA